jgi:hypothetical protein
LSIPIDFTIEPVSDLKTLVSDTTVEKLDKILKNSNND